MSELLSKYETFVRRKMAIRPHGENSHRDRVSELLTCAIEELGEVARNIKRRFYRDVRNERDNLREELGDTLFCVVGLAVEHGFTVRELIEANQKKLEGRYPELKEQRPPLCDFCLQADATKTHVDALEIGRTDACDECVARVPKGWEWEPIKKDGAR